MNRKKQQSQVHHIRKGVWVRRGEEEGNRGHHEEEEGNQGHHEEEEGNRGHHEEGEGNRVHHEEEEDSQVHHEEAEEEPFSQIKYNYEDACVVFS